jgi:hypothetical protein
LLALSFSLQAAAAPLLQAAVFVSPFAPTGYRKIHTPCDSIFPGLHPPDLSPEFTQESKLTERESTHRVEKGGRKSNATKRERERDFCPAVFYSLSLGGAADL